MTGGGGEIPDQASQDGDILLFCHPVLKGR